MRTNNIAFESGALRIRVVRCRAAAHDDGGVEHSATHTLVLPQAGVFIKHDSRHAAVVADPTHGIFFTADRPYRVSHPLPGGDDCLVVEYTREALLDLMRMLDPPAAEAAGAPFRAPAVRLDPTSVLTRRVLWYRLMRGVAGPLEVEETTLALISAAVATTLERPRPRVRTRRETSRQAEIVHATLVTIAGQPAEPWSLEALGRLVHSSPFHLARLFRSHVGMPIHRYQLLARLTRSLDEVLDSQRSLAAIAVDNGFAHHSHFTDAFHRAFRVTPSALRVLARSSRSENLRRILTAARRRMR